MSRQASASRRRSQGGQTIVEAALVITVNLVFIFGIIEFGRASFAFNQLAYLAQDGTRYASLRGKTVQTPATAASIQTYVQGRAVAMGSPSVTTTWQNNSNDPGNWVRVQVSYPLTFVAPFLPTNTLNLSAASQLPIVR